MTPLQKIQRAFPDAAITHQKDDLVLIQFSMGNEVQWGNVYKGNELQSEGVYETLEENWNKGIYVNAVSYTPR